MKIWDNPRRWIVVKTENHSVDGYLVELNIKPGIHYCGCEWYEFHQAKKSVKVPACKHVKLVIEHINLLASKCT